MSAELLLQSLETEIQESLEEINDLVSVGSEVWKRRALAFNTDPSLYNYVIQYPDWEVVTGTVEAIKSGIVRPTAEQVLELRTHLDSFRRSIRMLRKQLVPEPISLVFDEDSGCQFEGLFSELSGGVALAEWSTSSTEGSFCRPPPPFFHQRCVSYS